MLTSPTRALCVLCLGLLPSIAPAQPAANQVAGAWECRLPGQSTSTPPILWIALPSPMAGSAPGPEILEVDGFAGVVRGEGRLASGADGWSQFELASGPALWIKPLPNIRGRSTMLARLGTGGTTYRCTRLPRPPASS